MKSRNKVLSVLLALCMLLSLLPAAAFAEELPAEEPAVEEPAAEPAEPEVPAEPETPAEPEEETPVALQSAADSGIAVQAADTPAAALDLTTISETNPQGATYANGIYTKSVGTGNWTWDPNTKTLTLNNCDIKPMDESENPLEINGIEFPDGDVKLVLNGGNYIATPGSYAIHGGDDLTLTISGDGWLETQAKTAHIYCGNLVLQSGSVILQAGQTENAGIRVTNLTVNGGTLSAVNFKARAILAGTAVTINGGHVTASVTSGTAIAGTNNITVNSEATIMGGDNADNAAEIDTIGNQQYLDITVPAPAAPAFTDGFGTTIDNADTYEKDKTTNAKGYTFMGWFDGSNKELTDVTKAAPGVTYTARWTNNGKTVRTTPLELVGESDCKSETEGWSWNAATKTLTLNGVTFDVNKDAFQVIQLPDGAAIVTEKGTENVLLNSSEINDITPAEWGPFTGGGIVGMGKLAIKGEGALSVNGGCFGVFTMGDLTIGAPVSVNCTEDDEHVYAIVADGESTIRIDPSLCIKMPANGKVGSDKALRDGEFIAENDGKTPAKKVVIDLAAPAFTDGLGKTDCTFNTYTKGQTNAKGYTFMGWFDGSNKELTDVTKAAPGVTYAARWQAGNGKLVRTAPLDLPQNTVDVQDIAEGWSWNAAAKTLTLNGVTFDVALHTTEPDYSGEGAILLPDGAKVVTVSGSKNVITNSSTIETAFGSYAGGGILSEGALTIDGDGQLSVTGGCYGILTMGGLTINAPLSIKCTASTASGYIYAIMVHDGNHEAPATGKETITIASSLRIKTPAGGRIVSQSMSDEDLDSGHKDEVTLVYIVDGSGNAATELVIEKDSSSSGGSSSGSSGGSYNGTQSTVTSDLTSVTRVTVDGKTVSPKNYTVFGGNITFTDAFLKTLSNGLHKVTIENDKYIARGTFNVNNPAGTGAANAPKTADAGVALYAAMAAASLLGSGVVFTRRRREF